MNKEYIVYSHINKTNEKKYIGITCQKPQDRWGKDGYNYRESKRFWNAIQKYGWDNFDHVILHEGLSKEEACQKEKELIAELETTNSEYGYNIHEGGGLPPVMYGEDNPFFDDHRFAGENHPMYGKKHTEETKKKMSLNHRDVSKEKNPFYGDHRFAGKNHPNAKAIQCIETGVVYDTVTQAERDTGVARQSIAKQIRGTISHAGGLHWKYVSSSLIAS